MESQRPNANLEPKSACKPKQSFSGPFIIQRMDDYANRTSLMTVRPIGHPGYWMLFSCRLAFTPALARQHVFFSSAVDHQTHAGSQRRWAPEGPNSLLNISDAKQTITHKECTRCALFPSHIILIWVCFFEGIKVTKNILDLKVLESFKLQSKHHQLRDADFVKEPKLRNSAAPLTLRIRKIWENIYFDNK